MKKHEDRHSTCILHETSLMYASFFQFTLKMCIYCGEFWKWISHILFLFSSDTVYKGERGKAHYYTIFSICVQKRSMIFDIHDISVRGCVH